MNDKFKNPENMSRKEKLLHIAVLGRTDREKDAHIFWVKDCAGISKKAFLTALGE